MEREGNRLTRIYTRAGDGGKTRLVGGQEVSKADLRIESYGTVDELSAALGVARAANEARPEGAPIREDLDAWLRRLQNDLFHLGGDLATRREDRPEGMRVLREKDAQRLEQQMDRFNADLGPLKDFILSGGGPIGAQLHVARTVCRRAERLVVALSLREEIDPVGLLYLNRLSDYLFVLARWVTRQTGHQEYLWDHSLDDED